MTFVSKVGIFSTRTRSCHYFYYLHHHKFSSVCLQTVNAIINFININVIVNKYRKKIVEQQYLSIIIIKRKMLKEREGRGEKKNETKINAEKGITLPTRFKTFLLALTFEKFDLLWFVRLPNRYNKITIEFSALNFVKYFLFPRFDSNSTANFSRSINHKFGGGDDFGEMFVHANEYTRSLALILDPLSMKVIWQRVKLNVGASADLFERMTEIYVGGAQNFTPAPSIRDPRFRRLVPLIGNSTFRRWEITNLIENLWFHQLIFKILISRISTIL